MVLDINIRKRILSGIFNFKIPIHNRSCLGLVTCQDGDRRSLYELNVGGCLDHCRILITVADRFAISAFRRHICFVQDRACIDVVLRERVLCCAVDGFARGEVRTEICIPYKVNQCMIVTEIDCSQIYSACIGNRECICNVITHRRICHLFRIRCLAERNSRLCG